MNFKSAAALAALLTCCSSPSIAGDLPAAFNWSGFYVGATGAYGVISSIYNEREGGLGGGQIGFNFQNQNLVFGVEVDGLSGRISQSEAPPSYAISNTVGAVVSARGRIGVAFEQFLVYSTAGVTYAKNQFVWADRPGAQFIGRPMVGPIPMVDAQWHTGWTTGAGLEYALTQNWSTRIEYTYSRFGARGYLGGNTNNYGFDLSSVKAGVNYRF